MPTTPPELVDATLTAAPGPRPDWVKLPDGRTVAVPAGWVLVPPGDAGLTRRVKVGGPAWSVQEKRGNKLFSRGVWAPPEQVAAARAGLDEQRADPGYARKLRAAASKRDEAQGEYVEDFAAAVRAFLRFDPAHAELERRLAAAVTTHATPVGSGTVARTTRIPVADRAAAAVIAWLRHQTTGYDQLRIARVKGKRREVRRELAAESRRLLDRYRRPGAAPDPGCPLCRALAVAA